jgi:hypothetical protein
MRRELGRGGPSPHYPATRAGEESDQLSREVDWVAGLTLPNNEDTPTRAPQRGKRAAVARLVDASLLSPEGGGCRGSASDALAGMRVPKAPVNENGGTMTSQDNIGFTGQPCGVKAKPIAKTMQGCAHDAFRCGVLTANRGHALDALF